MPEPLYDRTYRRLEEVRWRLSDVPFNRVNPSLVPAETLEFVRVNCLLELSSLYATRMFLRDFRENPDFCQFMSIWYFEEMRHYLVLREYLKIFDRAPDHEGFLDLDTDLKPAPWPSTLVMHWCGELRLGMWYFRWAEVTAEPVLASVFKLIGEDEYRHAQCYEEFMQAALANQPELLVKFLNTAKWMLLNPRGDKHPTTYAEASIDALSVSDRIPGYEVFLRTVQATILHGDKERLERRILKTLSRLSGHDLRDRAALVRLSRSLAIPAVVG